MEIQSYNIKKTFSHESMNLVSAYFEKVLKDQFDKSSFFLKMDNNL